MYQRFDLTPIAVKQWNSIVYATDLNGKTRFLTIDFVFFYLTPLMAACVLAAFLGNHRPAVEFLSKFAILLTPLMLNLVFHVLRLQGDLKKAVPPPGKPLLDALADTCSSVLYCATLCFVLASFAGVGVVEIDLKIVANYLPILLSRAIYKCGEVVIYSLACHIVLMSLLVLKRTFRIVDHCLAAK